MDRDEDAQHLFSTGALRGGSGLPFGSGTFLDLDCQSQAARTLGAASWGQLLSAGLGEPNERAEPFLLAFQEELQHSPVRVACMGHVHVIVAAWFVCPHSMKPMPFTTKGCTSRFRSQWPPRYKRLPWCGCVRVACIVPDCGMCCSGSRVHCCCPARVRARTTRTRLWLFTNGTGRSIASHLRSSTRCSPRPLPLRCSGPCCPPSR